MIEDGFTFFLCILDLSSLYLLSELREKYCPRVRMSSIDCDEFDTDFLNSAANAVKDNWTNQDNSSATTKMLLRSAKKNGPKPSDDPIQIDLDCTITLPSSPLARMPGDTTSSSSRVSTLIFSFKITRMPSNTAPTQFYVNFAIYRQSLLLV